MVINRNPAKPTGGGVKRPPHIKEISWLFNNLDIKEREKMEHLKPTIKQEEAKTPEQKARYLIERFSWFNYQEEEREKAAQELAKKDPARIAAAFDWYINQHYDIMAWGEVLRWAIDYIEEKQNIL